jgi:hypoxia up-regulated 1
MAYRSLEKPIQTRYLERQGYPQALSDLQQAHWVTRIFLESAAQNATLEVKEGRPSKWTEEEIQDIERKLKDSEVWLNEGVEKQKKLKRCGDGDPPILINELKARGQTLQRQVQKLTRRKVPPIRASTSTGTESTSATSATETPTASTTESDTRATTTPVGEEKEHLRGEL